jgi:acyl carrier protein
MIDQYNKVFKEAFGLEVDSLVSLEYQSISAWDSVGHMNLIMRIEEEFNIMMETLDIIDFSSYQKGIELLKKYGVE